MNIIDPHLHLFALEQGDYHWLKKENPPFWPDKRVINKNFSDAAVILTPPLKISGFVHIEAGFDNQQPWRELAWLENNTELPFKSVAFIDISQNEQAFNTQLSQLKKYPSLTGCRHILDEQALALLTSKDAINNLAQLAKHQLSFDLQMSLIDQQAVNSLCNILSELPHLNVIINHAGWPPNNSEAMNIWQKNLKRISQYQQCAIKCSGWEMTDRHYSLSWLTETITSCITYFSVDRVMIASNFPLCLFSTSYQQYWLQMIAVLNQLKVNERDIKKLCFSNALHWYKLNT